MILRVRALCYAVIEQFSGLVLCPKQVVAVGHLLGKGGLKDNSLFFK